jgi:hypothetical protein
MATDRRNRRALKSGGGNGRRIEAAGVWRWQEEVSMSKRCRFAAFLLLLAIMAVRAPGAHRAHDSLLFTIELSNDTTTLFGLHQGGEVRRNLSGPVLMEKDRLLFYSFHGYALFERDGTLVDSHSVFKANRDLSDDDPTRLRCAYPLDRSTLMYYRETPDEKRKVTIYRKRVGRRRLRSIKDEEYELFDDIVGTQLFNLSHNSITDEMAPRSYLRPQLVGFTDLHEGRRWWSLDKFYTFASPVIGVESEREGFLFPGIQEQGGPSRHQLVEPVQSYFADGRRFYMGVHASLGSTEKTYSQTLYFIDHAGNIMFTDTLTKQVNKDVVLGEDESTFYTVKSTARYVFQPVVDKRGDVHYAILDFDARRIAVRTRRYDRYVRREHEPDLAHLVDIEKGVSWKPVTLRCDGLRTAGKTIPAVTITRLDGKKVPARARDLTRDEHIARIYRATRRDMDRKLTRRRSSLPPVAEAVRTRIAKESTAGCPYGVSLSGPRGMLVDFDYAPGERVLCARVIAARQSGDVIVRVDLEEYAEVLLFTREGAFIDRFIFNRRPYGQRTDRIVASATSPIVELDLTEGKERFYRWEPAAGSQLVARKQ